MEHFSLVVGGGKGIGGGETTPNSATGGRTGSSGNPLGERRGKISHLEFMKKVIWENN